MSLDRDNRDSGAIGEDEGPRRPDLAPGKRSLTTSLAEVMRLSGGRPAPGVTPELRTALEGESGSPLPDANRYSAEVGADVSHARVVTGASAAAAARSIDAQAFTVGDRVFFGDGGFQPGTGPGDHVIRHELTHVAQQAGAAMPAVDQLQFTAPGSAAEVEAHQVADGAAGAIGSQPAQVARFDYEAMQERQVGGNTYATINAKELYFAFGNKLVEMPFSSPSPFIKWSQGAGTFLTKFIHQMADLGRWDYDEWTDIARRVVMPEDFRALLNSGRVILGTGKVPKTGEEFESGPQRWTDSAAMPLAGAIHRRLMESIARVAPRFLAASLASADTGADLDPDAILASHPCDYVLLRTLCKRTDVVEVDIAGYREASSAAGAAPVDYTLVGDPQALEWHFLDDARGPSWIEVSSPVGATAELVAAHFWRTPQEATRIVASPPFFGLPMEDAYDLRKAKGLSTDHWNILAGARVFPWAPGASEMVENERDPAFGLLRSGSADQAALNEAGGEAAGAGADRGAVLKILERTRYGLQACETFAQSFGMGSRLSEPIGYIDGRLDHFATAPDDEVGRWYAQIEKQDDVVSRAAMGLESIQRHLENMGVADPSQMGKVPKAVRIPLDRVAQEFVDAAVLSRLVTTAEQRLAKAELDLELAPVETMELLLKDAQLRIYTLRKVDKKHYPSGENYDPWTMDEPAGTVTYSNGSASGTELMLRNELAQLRALVVARDPAAGPMMKELYAKIDRLGAETEVAQGHAMMSVVMEQYGAIMVDGWSLAGEIVTGDGTRPTNYWFKAMDYKSVFAVAWSLYVSDGAEGPKRAREYIVEKLGNDPGFASFLQRAYDVIDDIQTKVMILKIATLIGIVIATMGVGALAEGVAAGAGAGEVLAFVAGAAAEAGSFTYLNNEIFPSNDSMAGSMAVEFGTNLATFGLLRAWRLRKAAKVADDAMATAKLSNATRMEKMRGYLLKGKELTGEGLLIAATAYAQMQVDSLRQRGKFVSLSEIREQGKQGLAMVLGIAIGGRVFREQLDALRKLGSQAGEDLARRVEALRDLSKAVEANKSPEMALELVRQDRALLEAELELHGRTIDPNIKSYPPPPELVVGQHIQQLTATELTLALDEVVPGRVYMGTPDQLGPILQHLDESGAKVTPVEEGGRRRFEVEDGKRRYIIHEAQSYSTTRSGAAAPSPKAMQFEPDSVVGHVSSVSDGRDIMRRLAAGDRTALSEIGYDGFPPNLETSKVEWGLARRFDGKLAVVLGSFGEIDWSKLPHMKPLSHTHPFNEKAALVGKNGDGTVRIDELGDLSNDLTHLFPSAADIAVMARGNIRDHVVHTPFIDRGNGRIGNPGPNETGKTVDFVIEKSTYVGRWAAAEDVGVYHATITARTPDGKVWRGEIWAADAGGSMLFRRKPELSGNRLPPPKPRFETKMGTGNPILVGKLKRSGVPDPATDPSVANVMHALDSQSEKWLDELLDLEHAGRVRGVKEWFDGVAVAPTPERIGNMLLEIREARRLVDERPGEVFDLGADSRAPSKPGRPHEKDKSFDLEGASGGKVARSVEIKSHGAPLQNADNIANTLEDTIEKVTQRAGHGQPIEGRLESRIDVSFYQGQRGKNSKHGGDRYTEWDGNGNYQLLKKSDDTPILDAAGQPKGGNILDDMVDYLNRKPSAKALDQLTLVDQSGVLAAYENRSGTWERIK